MDTIIAAVTHEVNIMSEDELYLPLMAGAFGMSARETVDYVRDDYGDNISEKNPQYCELTGLYWMWKNCDADNIGLCHYRRYFAGTHDTGIKAAFGSKFGSLPGHTFGRGIRNLLPDSRKMRKSSKGFMTESDIFDGILTSGEADKLMEEYEIILPKARNYLIETNYSQYAHAHNKETLDAVREIIEERCPEYTDAFDGRMAMRTGHRFNMFIMRRDLLDAYCEWLFDILFELENRLTYSYESEDPKRKSNTEAISSGEAQGSGGQRRLYGYIGERLLDVWIDNNEIEYCELPYIFIGREHMIRKGASMAIRKLKSIRTELSGKRINTKIKTRIKAR